MKAQNQAKNQLSSIWKVFFSTPRISSRKINSITDCLLFEKWFESPSLNQRSKKNPWFLNSFSPTHPPKARVPKYLRPGPTSGGTLTLSSSGGHPGPGVNVLLILDNFPAKNTKNGSGKKDFQIEDIPKIIPMLRGLFLDFWSFELLLHSAISSIWNAFGRTPKMHLLFEIIPEYLL